MNDSTNKIAALIGICGIIGLIGWCMNFQNLFQYWPATGGIMEAPVTWWVSLIGIFVAPLGIFMGYFF